MCDDGGKMKVCNAFRLVFRSLYNKKFITFVLCAMSAISMYIIDVILTDYISTGYKIKSMQSMFEEEPEKINYISYLNLMTPEYTDEKGQELIEYVRENQYVAYCGRFCNAYAEKIIDGNDVAAVVIERDIIGIGNLGLKESQINDGFKKSKFHQVYVGYEYKNKFKIGDTFAFFNGTEDDCIIAGFLKKGASWPMKGALFNGASNLDTYTLNQKIVVITEDYKYFDNSGGMPDCPYYVLNDTTHAAQVQMEIVKKASEEKLGVKVVNEGNAIAQAKDDNNITQDKSFVASILLVILALISMSAASVVFCLNRKKQHGIMMTCGVKNSEIIWMNFMENAFILLGAVIVVWLIRQKEIFGDIIVSVVDSNVGLMIYPYYYAHCICIPIIFAVLIIAIVFVSGLVPAWLIKNINTAKIITSSD